jgi:hypothetical protein
VDNWGRRGALLRIIGPLKRAYEYPALFDVFRANPTQYLADEIRRIPKSRETENDIDDRFIQAELHDDSDAVVKLLDAAEAAPGGPNQPEACAQVLVSLLKLIETRLNPITSQECK